MNASTLLGPHRSRRLSLLVALLLLAALTSACTFEVQPIEEYTSPDGYLSITFPAAWDVLEEESGNGMTSALVGTHPDLVSMDVMPPTEAGVALMLMPDFVPGPEGDTVQVSAQEMADFMRQSAMVEQTGVSEIAPVQLESGAEAYAFTVPSPEADMTIHVFAPAEGTLAVVAVIMASGADDSTLAAEAAGIVNSVTLSGDPVEFGDRARALLGAGE